MRGDLTNEVFVAKASLRENVTLSGSARMRITGARHFQSARQSGLRVPVHHGKPWKTVARRPPARILQMQPGFGAPSPPKAKREAPERVLLFLLGADYGARTRHLDLGKVALYQMS